MIPKKIGNMIDTSRVGSISVYLGLEYTSISISVGFANPTLWYSVGAMSSISEPSSSYT
ncbi:MAG: hypothetical protein A4E36_00563 [Methanoregulaceae archaeon PtaB.Bin009]|nr:MAG: hypothetical protein A4E36_00563 [Methanoregulaceae archaeon PtaB.Bin009]